MCRRIVLQFYEGDDNGVFFFSINYILPSPNFFLLITACCLRHNVQPDFYFFPFSCSGIDQYEQTKPEQTTKNVEKMLCYYFVSTSHTSKATNPVTNFAHTQDAGCSTHLFSSRTCASSSGVKSLLILKIARSSLACFPCGNISWKE